MARRTPFPDLSLVNCWQNDFRLAAKDIMKTRKKIPICIPSYNRPNGKWIKKLADEFDNDNNYPIHIFVNNEQKMLYENSEYIKDKNWITIHAFPNNEISDIGLKRAKIVDIMFDLGYETIFMHDDDMTRLVPSIPHFRNEKPISRSWETLNCVESYNMWQLAAEYAWYKFDRAMYCLPMVAGFTWVPEFSLEESSYTIRGLASICMCINIKRLKEANLNFRSNKNNHHEDFDLQIRVIEKGYYPIEIHWMTFFTSQNKENNVSEHNTFLERYEVFQKAMLEDFKHIDWVIAKDRGIPNVGLNWHRIKKYLIENNFLDAKHKETKFNINMWESGKMLDYFKDGV